MSLFSWLGRWRAQRGPNGAAAVSIEAAQSSRDEIDDLLSVAIGHLQRSDAEGARACVSRALERVPQSATAHALAGKVHVALSDPESALDHFNLALHFNPDDWDTARVRSQLLESMGEAGRAISGIEAFVEGHPLHADAMSFLARLHYGAGRYEQALHCLTRVLECSPDDVDALNLYGLIQARELGRLRDGELALYKAVQLRSGNLDALSNLGWVYSEEGRTIEALQCFESVLSRNPNDHETRLMRSYALLKSGDFAQGWRDFDARVFSPLALRREIAFAPCDTLHTLTGRRVIVRAEQGLGDQIMFASCFQDLQRVCGACVLECDYRLEALFRRSFPAATVVAAARTETETSPPAVDVDCEVAMGSLPGIFRGSWDDFPEHNGYLRADPVRVKAWRRRLEAIGPGPYVGISWQGGAPATRRRLRSVPLTLWKELLLSRANFVSLQYGEVDPELRATQQHCGVHIWHWPEVISDYDETAALVAALDIVVSVCTAVVHLAGSLGKPVLVLTPATPEWRYLAAGERMPWYPSVRLMRQVEGEEWRSVIPRVSAALAEHLGAAQLRRPDEGG